MTEYIRADLATTATAMRDKCVEKVREIARDYQLQLNGTPAGALNDEYAAMRNAAIYIAMQLESLTLDQVQEKQ